MNTGGRQLGINMIANIISYSATIVVSFVLTPFLINHLGKETYSFYPIANSIVAYMSIVTNALNSIGSRFVTVSIIREDYSEANRFFSSVFLANVIISLMLLVPMILIVVFLSFFLDVPSYSVEPIKLLFAMVFGSALVNISSSVFGIATFARNRIELRSAREIFLAILRLSLFYFLYKVFTPSITYVGIVALVLAFCNMIIQKRYAKILLPEIKISFKDVSIIHIKKIMYASAWNIVNSLGDLFMAGVTLILANVLFGANVAGSVSIVQTVPNFINGIIVMLSSVFFPLITCYYAEGKKERLVQELKRSQTYVGLITGSVVVVFSCLAPEFFSLWTPNEDSLYLARLSLITIIPQIVISCVYSLHNLNIAMNKIKYPAQLMLFGGMVNIALTLVCAKCWQAGVFVIVGISTGIRLLFYGLFLPYYANQEFHMPRLTFFKPVMKSFVCVFITSIFILSLKPFCNFDSWVHFFISGGSLGICGLLVFAVGMIGPKKIFLLLHNK